VPRTLDVERSGSREADVSWGAGQPAEVAEEIRRVRSARGVVGVSNHAELLKVREAETAAIGPGDAGMALVGGGSGASSKGARATAAAVVPRASVGAKKSAAAPAGTARAEELRGTIARQQRLLAGPGKLALPDGGARRHRMRHRSSWSPSEAGRTRRPRTRPTQQCRTRTPSSHASLRCSRTQDSFPWFCEMER